MSHPTTTELCKTFGLACHDKLEALIREAVARGQLDGEEIVHLSITIRSGSAQDDAHFHAVGPASRLEVRNSEAA